MRQSVLHKSQDVHPQKGHGCSQSEVPAFGPSEMQPIVPKPLALGVEYQLAKSSFCLPHWDARQICIWSVKNLPIVTAGTQERWHLTPV